MKNILYYAPAVIALLFYSLIAYADSFLTVVPSAWVCTAVLFMSAVFLSKHKWYGALGGIFVGCLVFYMGTTQTGQIMDIERPVGLALFLYYIVCGYIAYKKR